jgi:hypothetical protein
LCRDGFKLAFESDKFIVSNFGSFVGKGYDCRGLLRVSISDDCNRFVNSISSSSSDNNEGDAAMWHSQLCHINFDRIYHLTKLNFDSMFSMVGRSKFHDCVRAKQPQKPFQAIDEKSLSPLD